MIGSSEEIELRQKLWRVFSSVTFQGLPVLVEFETDCLKLLSKEKFFYFSNERQGKHEIYEIVGKERLSNGNLKIKGRLQAHADEVERIKKEIASLSARLLPNARMINKRGLKKAARNRKTEARQRERKTAPETRICLSSD